MGHSWVRIVARVLVLAVLLMLGATTGAAVAHEIQHAAHHSSGMHSSGICAWMCATAGTAVTIVLQPARSEVVRAAPVFSAAPLVSVGSLTALLPRAPPLA